MRGRTGLRRAESMAEAVRQGEPPNRLVPATALRERPREVRERLDLRECHPWLRTAEEPTQKHDDREQDARSQQHHAHARAGQRPLAPDHRDLGGPYPAWRERENFTGEHAWMSLEEGRDRRGRTQSANVDPGDLQELSDGQKRACRLALGAPEFLRNEDRHRALARNQLTHRAKSLLRLGLEGVLPARPWDVHLEPLGQVLRELRPGDEIVGVAPSLDRGVESRHEISKNLGIQPRELNRFLDEAIEDSCGHAQRRPSKYASPNMPRLYH